MKGRKVWCLAALAAAVLCALAWVLRPVPLTSLLGAEPERIGLTVDWGDENGLQSYPLDQETQDELYRLLSNVRLSWRGKYAYIEYVEGKPIITVTFRGEERWDFNLPGDGYLYLDGTRYVITSDGGDLYARLLETAG
ncbi:hypothetical protein [Intestinimonas timonensis]|uniref:hypothetical protein n=1 Tax=Intestinimonas timonensis TaxID=1689270 RepID=UPI003A94DA32